MEHFANTSHDDILKLIDKSKNKKMAKATAACMNLHHTWAKPRGEVLELEKVEPKKLDEILQHFFYGTEKARLTRL